jgi:hypothetical protein
MILVILTRGTELYPLRLLRIQKFREFEVAKEVFEKKENLLEP